jgi:leucyl aminopeptidase
MEIKVNKNLDDKQDVLVLGLFEQNTNEYESFDSEFNDYINQEIEHKRISLDSFGELHSAKVGNLPYNKVLIVSLGDKEKITTDHLRRALGKATKFIKSKKYTSFTTNLPQLFFSSGKVPEKELGRATAEGLILSSYSFDRYLSKKRKEKISDVKEVSVQWSGNDEFNVGLKEGEIISNSSNFARDLVNESAKVCTPTFMEEQAKEVAELENVLIKVLEEKDLRQEGMNLMLSVNAGSSQPPKLIFMEYSGGEGKPIALVGKGITFDSGGYNLKPTKYIEDMKIDMAGSAAVLGTIKAAAELGLKKNLIGVMAMCENMVSAEATHPGDIIKSFNGKTVEIGNTDAEGRLVLADSLAYTEKNYEPSIMIDLATLTGSCVVALGYYTAALISKEEELIKELVESGKKSGDRVWPMPFFEEYHSWMDGSISDLNNISTKGKGYEAGSVTAGVFLSKFVEKTPWVHLDIAGSAYWEIEGDYLKKGATGSGIRLLSYWLLE